MSSYEMRQLMYALEGVISSFGGTIVAALLSGVVLTYGIRWFIFKKAGQKGWKALIPFYSDYINYKIAWDGRIYLAIIIGQVAAAILSAICGLISAGFGAFVSIVCNTIVMGAGAIAGMILQFKMARAFGRNDYFAIGLYLLGSVFTALLAFGDSEYKGVPQNDGIGVPGFIDNAGKRATAAAAQYQQRQQYQQYQQQQAQQFYPQQFQQFQPQQQPQQPQQQPQQQFQYQQFQPEQPAGARTARHTQETNNDNMPEL